MKYNENDLKNFKRDDYGFIICPHGDYTKIKKFGDHYKFDFGCQFGDEVEFDHWNIFAQNCKFGSNCKFGPNCQFGEWSEFGKGSKFDIHCKFKECSSFDTYCSFESGCNFEAGCKFKGYCNFGSSCRFEKCCNFGEHSTFEAWSSFGQGCQFEKECEFEIFSSFGERCNLSNNPKFRSIEEKVEKVLKIDLMSKEYPIYCFKTKNQIYIRCDDVFESIDNFEDKIKRSSLQDDTHYLEAAKYIKAIKALL